LQGEQGPTGEEGPSSVVIDFVPVTQQKRSLEIRDTVVGFFEMTLSNGTVLSTPIYDDNNVLIGVRPFLK
jgi:hypothetical protein